MDYFFKEVLPACSIGVFLTFRDGRWGAGVYKEAPEMARDGRQIWRITPEGKISPARLEDITPLSIEETRERVRNPEGKRIPY